MTGGSGSWPLASGHREPALPALIQGGMGVAVSGWRLARAVSASGQLGVVSGTAIAVILARRLQDGDPGGHMRRALARFPDQAVADGIVARYFRPPGRAPGSGYRAVPVPRWRSNRQFLELTVAASFVEVSLAKEGHGGPAGINLLEKIQIPTLPALYGAMLAGVDYVLMGAGIPAHIPEAIDALSEHRETTLPLTVAGETPADDYRLRFEPRSIVGAVAAGEPLRRPRFLAIVSSHVLASHLARGERGRPFGFVIERPTAGGHNAPPRGRLQLDDAGEPVYGPRDEVDMHQLRALGLPFWLAGGYASPAGLGEAREQGAAGVQVGSAFALCEESGLEPGLRRRAREQLTAGSLRVRTDPLASPTGYPFKVATMAGTASDPTVRSQRRRRCDLGYLSVPYRRENGQLGYRCAAEPEHDYVSKGGDPQDTEGRLCLCNGLTAAAGMPQLRGETGAEPALLTLGDEVREVLNVLSPEARPYHAEDVIRYVLSESSASAAASTG